MKRLTLWLVMICLTVTMSLAGTAEGFAEPNAAEDPAQVVTEDPAEGMQGVVSDSQEDLSGEAADAAWNAAGELSEINPIELAAASYPKLLDIDYKPTGNQQKDIVGYAKTQVGYAEGKNNNTYFGNWYGLNYNPWCAMFVSWCAAKAGVSKTVIPRLAAADRSWAKKQGVYHKSKQWGGNYTPQKGDLIYFSWSVRDYADHIGIVSGTETIDGTKYVNTIEGNKRDKVVEDSYKLNNKYILGYASPKYTSTEPTTYKLKYRDGVDETTNAEDEAVIAPVTGTFGKKLTLADASYVRDGHYYSMWQIYRLNKQKVQLFLCRDIKTDKKEKWCKKKEIPAGYQKITVACGEKLKLSKAFSDTAYASPVWKKEKYQISFDANGGVGAPEPQTKTYGVDLILPETKPTRSDCIFKGWAMMPDAAKAEYKAGKPFSENGTFTLYAVWTRVTDVFTVKVTRASGVDARTGPGKSYEVAGKYKKGKKLKIDLVENGWGRIKDAESWVLLEYTKVESGYIVKTTKKLTLRAAPGKENEARGKLKPGKHEITKINGTWGKVKSNGYWIDLDYTKRVK